MVTTTYPIVFLCPIFHGKRTSILQMIKQHYELQYNRVVWYDDPLPCGINTTDKGKVTHRLQLRTAHLITVIGTASFGMNFNLSY